MSEINGHIARHLSNHADLVPRVQRTERRQSNAHVACAPEHSYDPDLRRFGGADQISEALHQVRCQRR